MLYFKRVCLFTFHFHKHLETVCYCYNKDTAMTEKMQTNKQTNTSGKFYIKENKKEKVISGGFIYNLFLMLIDIYNDKRHEYCIRPE